LFFDCGIIWLNTRLKEIKPIKYYTNLNKDKLELKTDQKGKAGIYCLINLTNGKFYVGSSINLANRISYYLSSAFLEHPIYQKMPIIRALLKYGQDNFAVFIVEYTLPSLLYERETQYIEKFHPKYNIFKKRSV
jgi:excinuclease UvrABC nuclease subunit